MAERRICPRCEKPMYEDSTEAERIMDPPGFCSPLRCSAWTVIGKATKPNPITGARTMLRVVAGTGTQPTSEEA